MNTELFEEAWLSEVLRGQKQSEAFVEETVCEGDEVDEYITHYTSVFKLVYLGLFYKVSYRTYGHAPESPVFTTTPGGYVECPEVKSVKVVTDKWVLA